MFLLYSPPPPLPHKNLYLSTLPTLTQLYSTSPSKIQLLKKQKKTYFSPSLLYQTNIPLSTTYTHYQPLNFSKIKKPTLHKHYKQIYHLKNKNSKIPKIKNLHSLSHTSHTHHNQNLQTFTPYP